MQRLTHFTCNIRRCKHDVKVIVMFCLTLTKIDPNMIKYLLKIQKKHLKMYVSSSTISLLYQYIIDCTIFFIVVFCNKQIFEKSSLQNFSCKNDLISSHFILFCFVFFSTFSKFKIFILFYNATSAYYKGCIKCVCVYCIHVTL